MNAHSQLTIDRPLWCGIETFTRTCPGARLAPKAVIRRWPIAPGPDVAAQVARYGCDTAVINWSRRLRCSACDGRKVDFVVTGVVR
jgi:hypothetical protein